MKTAGIVGGIGPESTIDYYRFLIEGFRQARPEEGNSLILRDGPPSEIPFLDTTRIHVEAALRVMLS